MSFGALITTVAFGAFVDFDMIGAFRLGRNRRCAYPMVPRLKVWQHHQSKRGGERGVSVACLFG